MLFFLFTFFKICQSLLLFSQLRSMDVSISENNWFMTPYEGALAKKLTQAIELSDNLSKWVKLTGCDSPPEEQILRGLIQRIEHIFDIGVTLGMVVAHHAIKDELEARAD